MAEILGLDWKLYFKNKVHGYLRLKFKTKF
jgi:hypothetical protein